MEKTTWKTLAIIFFILFLIETLFFMWGISLSINEENNLIDCYYNVCSDYPDAKYESNICYCYDYDVIGELRVVKTEVIK